MPQTQSTPPRSSPPLPPSSPPSSSSSPPSLMTQQPSAQSLFVLRVLVIVLGVIFVFCAALFVYLLLTVEPSRTDRDTDFVNASSRSHQTDAPALLPPSPRPPVPEGGQGVVAVNPAPPDIALKEGESLKSYSVEDTAIIVLTTSPSQSRLIRIDMQDGTVRIIARFSPEALPENR